MNNYYIHDGDKQKGPFTIDELKSQDVKPTTSVWHDGLSEWTTAGKIDELQILFIKIPPPINMVHHNATGKRKLTIAFISLVTLILISLIIIYMNNEATKEAAMKSAQIELEQKNKESEKAIKEVKDELERKNKLATTEKQNEQFLEAKQAFYRNEWKKHIILTGSKYMVSGFGGIKGLDLTISNGTTYKIDNIETSVVYLKENGGVFKTEKVIFTNIPAGVNVTLPAPESERGMSVKISILKITSSSFHFCYDHNFELEIGNKGISTSPNGISGNPKDPWFCN
jgi:GYF domain 2